MGLLCRRGSPSFMYSHYCQPHVYTTTTTPLALVLMSNARTIPILHNPTPHYSTKADQSPLLHCELVPLSSDTLLEVGKYLRLFLYTLLAACLYLSILTARLAFCVSLPASLTRRLAICGRYVTKSRTPNWTQYCCLLRLGSPRKPCNVRP